MNLAFFLPDSLTGEPKITNSSLDLVFISTLTYNLLYCLLVVCSRKHSLNFSVFSPKS